MNPYRPGGYRAFGNRLGDLRLSGLAVLGVSLIVVVALICITGGYLMRRTALIAAVAATALLLAGCTTTQLTQVVEVVKLARNLYCVGISEAGRQAMRDLVARGAEVIVCPLGTIEAAPPAGSP